MAKIKKVSLEDENKLLRDELTQLKSMMQMLLSKDNIINETNNTIEEKSETEIEDDEFIEIKPTRQVTVTSLVHGRLVLVNERKTPFRIDGFGQSRNIRFEDIESICNINRNAFKNGWVYIGNKKDRDVIKALYLEEDYKNLLDKNTIENFINLSQSEMAHIFQTASNIQLETIIETITKGLLDFDKKYFDKNKIAFINNLIKEKFKGRVTDLDNLSRDYEFSSHYGKEE